MIFKIRFGKWKLTATLAPVVDVVGVNSLLPDGNHILMWDFDDVSEEMVVLSLIREQLIHDLPPIYELQTRPQVGYIAYCFTRMPFMQACSISAETHGICRNFYKWGVFRRRFTLRITPKSDRKPKLVAFLPSSTKEEIDITELKSFVQYETMADGHKGALIRLGC